MRSLQKFAAVHNQLNLESTLYSRNSFKSNRTIAGAQ
jgi:hypothetical protein